jgi:thioredoxin 1
MSTVREIQAAEFSAVTGNTTRPVLVDFHAAWCPPCKLMAPVLEALAGEFSGRIDFVKIDAEEAPELAGQFGVESIPTTILFRNGQEIARKVGFAPQEDLRALLTQALNSAG